MTKTLHGKAHGTTIELDEHLGVPDGQEVEVQVTVVSPAAPMSEGLAKVYAILGERFDSGEGDVAARLTSISGDRRVSRYGRPAGRLGRGRPMHGAADAAYQKLRLGSRGA